MRLDKLFLFVLLILLGSCNQEQENYQNILLEILDSSETGIDFSNDLTLNTELNILNYMYYYNGGGLASGDLNNDGLIDLIFSSNLGEEKVYINKGNLKFEDVSSKLNVDGGKNSWTTGISLVDINLDGILDIYLCQVGNYRNLDSNNKFFISQGMDENNLPIYEDKAAELGLNFKGFSTQAGFFDFDMDGDLDMYLMNHSLHHNGTFGKRSEFLNSYDSLSGDRLYRNDNQIFKDVTKTSGIYSHVSGYGLGLAFGDINMDGWPDIYVANDFHENDYLYINQKDGTFKEALVDQMMHTSRFSMGVDIADINNDCHPDIISLDMLPEDPVILKRSEGEDALDIFKFKLNYGYNHQYAKNNLQLNTGHNSFKEVAMYSGVHATDWSWSPLMFDIDMDGHKDIFISNGIPKRMNDIDYINFISGNEIQYKIQFDHLAEQDLSVIDKIPEIKLNNKVYLFDNQNKFSDAQKRILNDKISYSNSAIYADLDNDGDYDIVTNNIDEKAFLYKNHSSTKAGVVINLKGPASNPTGLGTKIICYQNQGVQYIDHYNTRGFQSCMNNPVLAGNNLTPIDSIIIIWPDNGYQIIQNPRDPELTLQYQADLPKYNYDKLAKASPYKINDITSDLNLDFRHIENPFVEFNREPLIPHCTSSDGPALAIGDLNNDGLDDIFIGSSKRKKRACFIQNQDARFTQQNLLPMGEDSIYEEVDAVILDVNNDNKNDLLVANGGNEYRLTSKYNRTLAYLGDGKLMNKNDIIFDSVQLTASCILPGDFNNDGYEDVFIGARANPWNYGEIPKSYLFINKQDGNFAQAEKDVSDILSTIGFVKNGQWIDIDKDGDQDLILAAEWSELIILLNENNTFKTHRIGDKKGWWNFVKVQDYDNDGDLDILAGNVGLNTRLKASATYPVKMYYADFDDNGTREQILTYYLQGKEIPFSNMMEIQKQIPMLKKKFLYAREFAEASIEEIFSKEKLQSAIVHEANYFENTLFVNNGNMEFEAKALPHEAQLTSYYDAHLTDFNEDGLVDVFITGNYYDCNIQMGRYDADYGSILINKGQGEFEYIDPAGVEVKNQVRRVEEISLADGTKALVLAKNNDALQVITITKN